ncbi:hypothetical protein NQ315_008576 [Exocentrus adspersus]|uniref:RING-type E3 ubiquitin transferase n=1 Tax=Exocentrus adspersus TaxID=1586481 RepID=A0AAV8W6I4_9CUCU|nr:hypothetical protein NQ315_008576 [Exocentrus adspersus]
MRQYEAKVADVLRLTQRDETFLQDVENQMHTFFKFMGARSYHKMRKIVPRLAYTWYYLMTSLGNLQTLGEEYTGTIRVTENGAIPSKMIQTLWLILYIGGEPLLDRLLSSSKDKISKSTSLRQDAKSFLLKSIDFIRDQKPTISRIHHSIFYTNGKYYNISNRLTGIKYVLLRQWLQDDSFTGSFNLLGHLSLFYILFSFVHQFYSGRSNGDISENIPISKTTSNKMCVLCSDSIKSPCATTCGHVFCWTCIYESLSYQKLCPVCREGISPSRVIFLQNYA